MASLPARMAPILLFFGLLGWTVLPVKLPSEAVDITTQRNRCFIPPTYRKLHLHLLLEQHYIAIRCDSDAIRVTQASDDIERRPLQVLTL